MHIVLFGGSGFLGSRIAATAIASNHTVSVITRSALPSTPLIKYVQADIYDPKTYSKTLECADAVIHSVGTFFPSTEYKKLISEQISPFTPFKLLKARIYGQNPMDGGYTKINTTSAELVASATNKFAEKKDRKIPFVYISAEKSCLTNDDYIQSKRRAEQLIAANKGLKSVFLRPGIIYDPASQQISRVHSVRQLAGAGLGILNQFGAQIPTTPIDVVASAAIEACDYPEIEGVISHPVLSRFETMKV